MANLKKKFQEILDDLEKNIKDKEDLEYIKSQVYNVSLLFLDEIDKMAESNFERINIVIEREKELTRKISKMERMIENIEKEVFFDPATDFEIICPYCNTEFIADMSDGEEHEIKCPKCGNVIDVDWDDDMSEIHFGGDCDCDCDECMYDEDDDEDEEDQEDDM